MTLKTEPVYPPIPTRNFDWVAYDDDRETGPHYWGRTEQEAIDAFNEDQEESLPVSGDLLSTKKTDTQQQHYGSNQSERQ